MRRRAVIVDEDDVWRESLQRILEDADFDVVGNAWSVRAAVPLVREHSPDLLVTDFADPDLISEVRASWQDLRIVVTSDVRDPAVIERALSSGVNVYVFKTSHPDDIVSALGQAFEVTFILLSNTYVGSRDDEVETGGAEQRVRDAGLTRRELELLGYIAAGSSNREIARALWVTEQTVKFHLSNINRKLGVSNRTEASHWAHTHRVVPTSSNSVATGS
jgi:DNA-binding NarL/FixJ family response regulator